MKKMITGALTALTLGGAGVAGGAPASAQGWYHGGDHGWRGGGWRGGGWGPGAAVGAGLLGLAVGAAIADRPHYYGGYAAPYAYGPGYGYYAPPCRSHWRWDPYIGRYVRVSACY